MRGFFILLLLTNIAFIAWQYVQEEGKQEVIDIYHGINMVNEGLIMLSELPPEEQPALREIVDDTVPEMSAKEDAVKSPAVVDNALTAGTQGSMENVVQDRSHASGVGCFLIGAIDEYSALEQLQRLLQANGATVIDKGEKQAKKTNYWVILPPYSNRAKADEAAAILGRKRVKDFFIVRSGEYQNAISLGVFSTRDRAERRYKQIVDLKGRLRRPRIETIESPAKRYFVHYSVADDSSSVEVRKYLLEMNYPSPEEIRCK